MRIRIVFASVLLAATAACGNGDQTSGDTSDGANAAPNSGVVIEVQPKLIEQGFEPTQVAAIAPNSAFWLLPFNTPFSMSQNPTGQSTCVFRMVRDDFGTDPAKKAYVDYPIKNDSKVKLTARLVSPDGAMGEFLPGEKVVALTEVTPGFLGSGTGIDLGTCEDVTSR
ncbi:MAG TPA: hypothetical protein VJM46_03050 [Candidatus Saccharimonadales bacterium]|nr:hypothetical protein [Candidatus Saccharimonadales bacterium]